MEAIFRHSWWSKKRDAIRRAHEAIAPHSNATQRFNDCGRNCWVMECSTEPGRFRLSCDRCRSRWCDACAQDRRRTVTANLVTKLCERYKLANPAVPCKHIRFLTLTMKSAATPLKEQLDRLYSCWGRFRHRPQIAACIKGGIAFLELSRNRQTGHWHPHLHVLFEGEFLPHAVASKAWLAVTTDSFIVDVRAIRTVGEACGYVVKYATKAVSANVWADPEALKEAMVALVGKRTFNSFGTWRQFSLARPAADDLIWEPIMSLLNLVAKSRSGDIDAARILTKLTKGPTDEPINNHARDPT